MEGSLRLAAGRLLADLAGDAAREGSPLGVARVVGVVCLPDTHRAGAPRRERAKCGGIVERDYAGGTARAGADDLGG